MKKTVIIGDGLTRGIPGVSYYRFLHKKEMLQNKGAAGMTLLGAVETINRLLRNPKYDDTDCYVLQIGLNDVLFPVLKLHSRTWNLIVNLKVFFTSNSPCNELDLFMDRYEKLILKLLANKKEVVVIGLPYMENQVLMINDTLERYNIALKRLCQKYKLKFLDLRELEKNSLQRKKGSYFVGKTAVGTMADSVVTSVLPFSNAVSRWRGLSVTVDGVHLNYRMAKKFAKMAELKLLD